MGPVESLARPLFHGLELGSVVVISSSKGSANGLLLRAADDEAGASLCSLGVQGGGKRRGDGSFHVLRENTEVLPITFQMTNTNPLNA